VTEDGEDFAEKIEEAVSKREEFMEKVRKGLEEYKDGLGEDYNILYDWVKCLRIDGLEDLTEMKLACGEAAAPVNPDNVAVATELIIYRSGLGSKLSNVGNAVFALARILSNILRESAQLKELKEYLMTEKRLSIYKIASDIADYIINKYKVITPVIKDKVLGIYCYDSGAYRECENDVVAEFKRVARALGLSTHVNRYTSVRTDFIQIVEDSTKVFKGFNHHLLLFRNGVIDWRRLVYEDVLEVMNPSPDLMIYHKLPWPMDFDVLRKRIILPRDELFKSVEEDLSELINIFKEWVGDKWVLLVEIIGYTLLAGDYPLNKAVMLVGDGKNGKSSYLGLVKHLLGPENVVSVKLQDLTSEDARFAVFNLYGKMANIFADLPKGALKETGIFKVLTGEDAITADRKFRDPITFVNYAKMLYSANELPKVYDMTAAFWRRWLVIEFPNAFPPNEGFKRRLYGELLPKHASKLLAYSLLAARHAVKSGRFSFEESEADYKDLWMRETNTVYAFLQDAFRQGLLVRDPDAHADRDDVYNLYVKYCEAEEREALDKAQFTKELEHFGIHRVKVRGYYYYKGIRLGGKEGN
jgi:putative DNA primase/helicase